MSPVATDSLVQIAYDTIRESIVDGRLRLGEHIVEQVVADELKTSRAPVREALRRLQQEGLVCVRPRRGIFVREITAKDFIDIYNVRIAVECAAARLIVRILPPLDSIELTIHQMAQAVKSEQLGKVVDLELKMHQQMCDLSGNDYLASVFHSLAGPIRMALGVDDAAFEHLYDVVDEHLTVLEALKSGHADHAAVVVHQHIIATVGPVLSILGGDERDLFAVATSE
jgi:DNA-binding GntR family transcriptional regulator